MVGYSDKSLSEKLGLKEDITAIFLQLPTPVKFELQESLKKLNLQQKLTGKAEYIHLFTTKENELTDFFVAVDSHLKEKGMIWISWPKKMSGITTQLNENIIRESGLAKGFVDVKVCAVDNIWSGLKFYRRQKPV
jgi:hypothetical protein